MKNKFDFNKFKTVINGIIIGTVVGIITSCFRMLIERMFSLMQFAYKMTHHHWILVILILFINILIALVIELIARKNPSIKGSGIPQAQGQIIGKLKYAWPETLCYKFITSVLTVGSGIFLGPEGPAIQIGACTAQGLSIIRTNNDEEREAMMAGGVAAGLSTVFNAPIASALFVLEGVYRNFSVLASLTALTSSIIANFISTFVFGEIPLFHLSNLRSYPLHDYGTLILLGVVLGILGHFYQMVTLKINSMQFKIHGSNNFNILIPLLLVIPCGMFLPMLIGSGSGLIIHITHFNISLELILVYLILRFVLSEIAMGIKAPGGIFVPMLVIGGLIGAAFGKILIQCGMLNQIYLANIIIISMVGFFASISQTPFTSIILITEMVGTLQHLMSLAFVTVIAYLVADILGNGPIYDLMLNQVIKSSSVKSPLK